MGSKTQVIVLAVASTTIQQTQDCGEATSMDSLQAENLMLQTQINEYWWELEEVCLSFGKILAQAVQQELTCMRMEAAALKELVTLKCH